MNKIGILILFLCLSFTSCYQAERNCSAFREGEFTFTSEINGEEVTTVFKRTGDLEIESYAGQTDTASIRWINDCEYVLRNLHPENRAEEKQVHIKILSTTENSYRFEYKYVGSSEASTGTAFKTD